MVDRRVFRFEEEGADQLIAKMRAVQQAARETMEAVQRVGSGPAAGRPAGASAGITPAGRAASAGITPFGPPPGHVPGSGTTPAGRAAGAPDFRNVQQQADRLAGHMEGASRAMQTLERAAGEAARRTARMIPMAGGSAAAGVPGAAVPAAGGRARTITDPNQILAHLVPAGQQQIGAAELSRFQAEAQRIAAAGGLRVGGQPGADIERAAGMQQRRQPEPAGFPMFRAAVIGAGVGAGLDQLGQLNQVAGQAARQFGPFDPTRATTEIDRQLALSRVGQQAAPVQQRIDQAGTSLLQQAERAGLGGAIAVGGAAASVIGGPAIGGAVGAALAGVAGLLRGPMTADAAAVAEHAARVRAATASLPAAGAPAGPGAPAPAPGPGNVLRAAGTAVFGGAVLQGGLAAADWISGQAGFGARQLARHVPGGEFILGLATQAPRVAEAAAQGPAGQQLATGSSLGAQFDEGGPREQAPQDRLGFLARQQVIQASRDPAFADFTRRRQQEALVPVEIREYDQARLQQAQVNLQLRSEHQAIQQQRAADVGARQDMLDQQQEERDRLLTSGQRAAQDIGIQAGRQQRDIGLGLDRTMRDLGTRRQDMAVDIGTRRADATADLAARRADTLADLGTRRADTLVDIDRGQQRAVRDLGASRIEATQDIQTNYRRTIRNALIPQLPGPAGAIMSARLQRRDQLADLATQEGRAAGRIERAGADQRDDVGVAGARAERDLGVAGGRAERDMAMAAERAERDAQVALMRAERDARQQATDALGASFQAERDARDTLGLTLRRQVDDMAGTQQRQREQFDAQAVIREQVRQAQEAQLALQLAFNTRLGPVYDDHIALIEAKTRALDSAYTAAIQRMNGGTSTVALQDPGLFR